MARQVLDNGVILPSEYSDDWYDDMTSNLTKLDEVIGSNAEKLSASDVGETAISNNYDDLDDKPAYNILRRASVTLTAGGTGNYTDLDSDSKIKAGDYVLDAANKLYSITAIDAANSTYTVSAAAIINITDKSELGAAALSNSYDDLNNLPGYGILRFCSTAITDNSNVAFANISSVSKIAAGDFLLDTAGKLYQIASVDTANETVSVTTPLTQLAVDSDVVHKSGVETIGGEKTFTDNNMIKTSSPKVLLINTSLTGNTAPSSNTASLFRFDGGTVINFGGVQCDFLITGENRLTNYVNDITKAKLNTIQQRVNSTTAMTVFNADLLTPANDGVTALGSSSKRWSDVQTYKVNGLEPSALSLPSDNPNDIIDISGYLTILDGSNVNTYVAPANGWISITMSSCSGIQAYITGLWGHQIVRPTVGGVRFFMPVLKNKTTNILIFGGTIDNARFIPCQGNV